MHHIPFTPSAGCGGLGVQVMFGRPPDNRVHAGASLCTCFCIPVYMQLMRLGLKLCVGLLSLLRGLS